MIIHILFLIAVFFAFMSIVLILAEFWKMLSPKTTKDNMNIYIWTGVDSLHEPYDYGSITVIASSLTRARQKITEAHLLPTCSAHSEQPETYKISATVEAIHIY